MHRAKMVTKPRVYPVPGLRITHGSVRTCLGCILSPESAMTEGSARWAGQPPYPVLGHAS
jgi:hypothetical protein